MPDFEGVYEEYFSFVWASARRLGVDPAALDDVVQEVFLVIHSRLHTVEKPESLRSWVYGVVRRVASHHRRAVSLRSSVMAPRGASPIDAPSGAPSPAQVLESSQRASLLWSILDTMDEAKREVFILSELDEMSAPEISEALGLPVNTVYSRVRHARQAFEEELRVRLAEPKRRVQ